MLVLGLVLVLVRAADTNCGHHCTNIRHAYNRFHLSKLKVSSLLVNYISRQSFNVQMLSNLLSTVFYWWTTNLKKPTNYTTINEDAYP